MSILLETEAGWIISHAKFFENIKVEKVDSSPGKCLKLNPELFQITEPFRDGTPSNGKAKGKKKTTDSTSVTLSDTSSVVKQLAESVFNHPDAQNIFLQEESGKGENNGVLEGEINDSANCDITVGGYKYISKRSNEKAVQTSRQFFETVKDIQWPVFHGRNPHSEQSILSKLSDWSNNHDHQINDDKSDHHFIFLSNTSFYCNDVSNIEKILGADPECKFDLVILDPPWRNKFIRRKKRARNEAGYQMINDDVIGTLPIKQILNPNGIVVVWCTNAKSHQDSLLNEIFPKWGVTHLQTMYWLKVTTSGIPICPFNEETKKQPYETIIVGCRTAPDSEGSLPLVNKTDPKVIISVPSCINSHKPPLIDVLCKMFDEKTIGRKCEIFARYLVPGFTSVGNEVIKLQHIHLFVDEDSSNTTA